MNTPSSSRDSDGTSLNIKIVARRFWPYSGATEMGVLDLAQAMAQQGHQVEVITIAWNKTWPSRFRIRSIDVYRLNRPSHGPWGSYRYLKNLSRYLDDTNPDLIVATDIGEELITVSKIRGDQTRLLVRIDETTLPGMGHSVSLSSRQVTALSSADRVVVDSHWTRQRLADVLRQSVPVHVAADAVEVEGQSVARTLTLKRIARRALAEAHPMFHVAAEAPLVVALAPMLGDLGWLDLVNAWQRVASQCPNARLWIVGEGPKSRQIWESIVERQLSESVIMPGQLDQFDDLFQSADLVVHPLREPTFCSNLLRAMAAGVGCLVTPRLADVIGVENGKQVVIVPAEDPDTLAVLMLSAMDHPTMLERLGELAFQYVRDRFKLSDRLGAYLVGGVEPQPSSPEPY